MEPVPVDAAALRAWAKGLAGRNPGREPIELVGHVVVAVAAALGVDLSADEVLAAASGPEHGLNVEPAPAGTVDLGDGPPSPRGWADPWLPGLVHEQVVSAADRDARGAWYTPEAVVRGLVRLATPADHGLPPFAVDPTCGGGAFLLALLDRCVELGANPRQALATVAGMDIDPGAVTVSRWSMLLWGLAADVDGSSIEPDVVTGDALACYPEHWPETKLVIGNPPFATPLRTGAVPPAVASFRDGREDLLGPYTDLAAMHLLAAVERSAPSSTVLLVQPQSVLAGRDTGPIRDHCARVAPLHGVWAARESVFDAGVRACAPLLRIGQSAPENIVLAAGPNVVDVRLPDPEPDSHEGAPQRSWAASAARALGAPALPPPLRSSRPALDRLGALAEATAGFRDEYYGLVEACAEWSGAPGAEPNRLLTVGAVEPLATRWGVDPLRFGGRKWLRPWIDVSKLDAKVGAWTERRLQPKVVVATQSKLLEPVIDREGTIVPATPLLAVHAEPEDLAHIAAVLLAPPVVAWAWQQWFGTAMAVDALKLAAKQVVELPLPADRRAWDLAAELLAGEGPETVAGGAGLADEVAERMNRAYRADDAVLQWWRARVKAV